MALDRELASVLVGRGQATVEQDIRRMITTALEKYPKRTPEMYHELGRILVGYNGIGGKVEIMADLLDMFVRLGRDVAFVVQQMDDAGMFYEEPVWLGSIELKVRCAGGETFEFSPILKELPAIRDCNERERLVLFTYYLVGIQWGLARFYGKYDRRQVQKA